MNTEAARHNIKNRELTDEWVDMAWTGFNGFTADTDGVTKDDLLYVLEQIGMWLRSSTKLACYYFKNQQNSLLVSILYQSK